MIKFKIQNISTCMNPKRKFESITTPLILFIIPREKEKTRARDFKFVFRAKRSTGEITRTTSLVISPLVFTPWINIFDGSSGKDRFPRGKRNKNANGESR